MNHLIPAHKKVIHGHYVELGGHEQRDGSSCAVVMEVTRQPQPFSDISVKLQHLLRTLQYKHIMA